MEETLVGQHATQLDPSHTLMIPQEFKQTNSYFTQNKVLSPLVIEDLYHKLLTWFKFQFPDPGDMKQLVSMTANWPNINSSAKQIKSIPALKQIDHLLSAPSTQHSKETRQLYLELRLRQIKSICGGIEKKLSETVTKVGTLYRLQAELLRNKFDSGLLEFGKELRSHHTEYVKEKTKFTLQNQEAFSEWLQQYNSFIQTLLHWLGRFLEHQRCVLVLGKDILEQQVLDLCESILIKTEKFQNYIQQRHQSDKVGMVSPQEGTGERPSFQATHYLNYLTTLYSCWESLEQKNSTLLGQEIATLDINYQNKLNVVNAEKKEVAQLKANLKCLEDEADQLYKRALQDPSVSEIQLRSTISVQKAIEVMKPRYKNRLNVLSQVTLQLQDLEEKGKAAKTRLPDVAELTKLIHKEMHLLQRYDIFQKQHEQLCSRLFVDFQNRVGINFKKFRYYFVNHVELSFRDRKHLSWTIWGEFEEHLRIAEPRLLMIINHLAQYRDEWLSMVSQGEFQGLITNLHLTWTFCLENYVNTRIQLEKSQLDLLSTFADETISRFAQANRSIETNSCSPHSKNDSGSKCTALN